jgi:hypothetical protein
MSSEFVVHPNEALVLFLPTLNRRTMFSQRRISPRVSLLHLLIKKAILLAGLALVKHGRNRTRFERAENITQEGTGIERMSRKNLDTTLFPVQLAETTMRPARVRTRQNHLHPSLATANNEPFPTLYRRDQ